MGMQSQGCWNWWFSYLHSKATNSTHRASQTHMRCCVGCGTPGNIGSYVFLIDCQVKTPLFSENLLYSLVSLQYRRKLEQTLKDAQQVRYKKRGAQNDGFAYSTLCEKHHLGRFYYTRNMHVSYTLKHKKQAKQFFILKKSIPSNNSGPMTTVASCTVIKELTSDTSLITWFECVDFGGWTSEQTNLKLLLKSSTHKCRSIREMKVNERPSDDLGLLRSLDENMHSPWSF